VEEIGTPSTAPIINWCRKSLCIILNASGVYSLQQTLATLFMLKLERSVGSISPIPAWIVSMNLHESAHWKFLQTTNCCNYGSMEPNYPQCLLQGTQAIKVKTISKPEIKANQGRENSLIIMKLKSFFLHYILHIQRVGNFS